MATTATVRGGRSGRISGQRPERAIVAAVEQAIRSTVRPPRSRYLHEFTQAFRHFQKSLTTIELAAELRSADVLLVGDYHALPACQEFVTFLLQQFAGLEDRPFVLGLEAIYASRQTVLDSWLASATDADRLRERLQFDRDWGYDWEPYRNLLMVARKNCEAVWGLDSEPRKDLRRLRMRDRHAVGRIAAMRDAHPDARLVVLMGESHLAPKHLPLQVRETLPGERVVTVLQNVDAIYWQVADGNGAHPPAVRVSEDVVCVFNATPMEKYESYQAYLDE